MLPDASAAFQFFVAAAHFVLAATLALGGRRRPEDVTLVVFLGLVGANFAAGAMHAMTADDTRWERVAVVAQGLDPYFLLAFVTQYPFPRRTPLARTLLAVAACAGLGVAALAALGWQPASDLGSANLAVAYGAAWFLAVRAAAEAPTPQLARRGGWLAAAVGVAVLPRIALVPQDFRLRATMTQEVAAILLGIGAMVVLLVAARRLTKGRPGAGSLVAPFRLVAGFAGIIGALLLFRSGLAPVLGLSVSLAWPYGLRWLLFGGILVHGILAYEVLEFRRATDRTIPFAGAAIGAMAALLGAAAFAGGGGTPEAVAWPLAVAAGAACSLPAWVATRGLVRSIEAQQPQSAVERRLTLYQAALEAAWARGPPGLEARRLLEADRRAFGVSFEEARGLEHAVAAAYAQGSARLRPGDEPATGLVLEEVLGEGAHGRVFLARRYPSGDRVVVKELHPDVAQGRDARQRLLRELRALQRLRHPGIVRLLEASTSGGRHLLVMEHVDGSSMAEALARAPLPPARVRSLLADVLDALETAHASGVVHGDVKPANILVGRDDRARLTDFGLASLRGEERVRVTATNIEALGRLEGSLGYMAPEQVQGTPAGPATDLYALGIVAYEALTGRAALDLRGCGLLAALDRISKPRIALDAAPLGWQPWLRQALAAEPGARFPSASAMRRALP